MWKQTLADTTSKNARADEELQLGETLVELTPEGVERRVGDHDLYQGDVPICCEGTQVSAHLGEPLHLRRRARNASRG